MSNNNENVFDGFAYMVVGAAIEAKASGLSADDYEWNEYELSDSIRSSSAHEVKRAYDISLTKKGAVQLKQTARREAVEAGDPTLASYIERALDAAIIGAVDTWVAEEREESQYDVDDDDEDEDDY